MVFWTFVIGPLGAILAIPLTLLVRALVLEGDPRNNWLRWLSGDDVTDAVPSERTADDVEASPDTDDVDAAGGIETDDTAAGAAADVTPGTTAEQDPAR